MYSQKALSTRAALVAAIALVSVGLPTTAATVSRDGIDVPAMQGVIFKRPSAVGVTNTATGEKGCHNEKTQTSEPGPCPKDY